MNLSWEQATQLVAQLKGALAAKEERINLLELELARAGVEPILIPAASGKIMLSASASAARLHRYVADECQGLYDDYWLAPLSILHLTADVESKTLVLTFYLPKIDGLEAKTVSISPSHGDAQQVKVRRGAPQECKLKIPALDGDRFWLRLDADPEPAQSADTRELGVLLTGVSVT